MTNASSTRAGHLRGLGRLAADATLGVTELVEAVHRTISAGPAPLRASPWAATTSGIAGLVYGSVRGATRIVGSGIDAALARLAPLLGDLPPSPRREALVAVLNGVLGDHLEATGNPLAVPMRLRRNGKDLESGPTPWAAIPADGPREIVLMLHGLCMNDAGWCRDGHDHGEALERDLGLAAVHVVYNSGRHVSTNGRELAMLLEARLGRGSVPPSGLTIVAHSMGGLLARSAIHFARGAAHAWPRLLRAVVFLGTPHHGAPLERLGNLFQEALGATPWSLPFGRLGKIRSAGITDLRHGDLLVEDREGADRFARHADSRHPVPLPAGLACFAVAGTKSKGAGDRLAGDGLVPVASALGRHRDPERTLAFPPERTLIAFGTNHIGLLGSRDVYERIRGWVEAERRATAATGAACSGRIVP
ncbi:MAG: alpha/beta hydrolase [Thermoanaerobaculia bacterium]|nr:alpha/beta hydrolase [Thermoanaerobaculia bacterium]